MNARGEEEGALLEATEIRIRVLRSLCSDEAVQNPEQVRQDLAACLELQEILLRNFERARGDTE
jgi:hypothetical protein